MRQGRKSQLSSFAILLGLILFSLILLSNLNLLAWPVGPELGLVKIHIPEANQPPDGLLEVTTQMNLTAIPPVNQGSSNQILTKVLQNAPLKHILVTVARQNSSSATLSNYTDSTGQVFAYLPPATYEVSLLDWRLNYSTIALQVFSGKVTQLNAVANGTTYPIQTLNVVDSDSSGWLAQWENIFALVPSAQIVTAQNPSVYLATGPLSPSVILSSTNASMVTPVSITSNVISPGLQRLQLQVSNPVSIDSIQTTHLLCLRTVSVVVVFVP